MKPRPPLVILLVAVLAALISLIPLGYLLFRVFAGGVEKLVAVVFENRTLELVTNSLLLAIAVALTAMAVGSFQAFIAVRTNLPARRLFAVLAALPLAIPSYVAAYSWISVIPGFSGFWAAWLVLSFGTAPFVYLAVTAALARFDSAAEEVAQSLGSNRFQVFRRVTWPAIRPAALSGGLLSALYVLSDFGAVSILRYDTFTRAIYNAYRASFDRNLAASLALVLVIVTASILLIESRIRGVRDSSEKISNRLTPTNFKKLKVPTLVVLTALATVGLMIPLGSLLTWSVLGIENINLSQVLEALLNSLTLAIAGGILTAFFAVAVALVLVRYRLRIGVLMEKSLWITHATPGIVVALSLVYFSNQILPGIYQTIPLLLVAYLALFLPNALAAVSTPLRQSPVSLDEIASSLGLSRAQILRKVVLPIAAPGIFAGAALVMLTILKELPVTLLLRPTGVETLSTRLWTETSVSAFSEAAPYALLLVVLAGIPAWLLNRSIRKDLEPSDLERVN